MQDFINKLPDRIWAVFKAIGEFSVAACLVILGFGGFILFWVGIGVLAAMIVAGLLTGISYILKGFFL